MHIQRICFKNKQGYTMIELVVVAAIIMFAGVFFLRISGSITGRGQYTTTDNRMTIIEAKIRQYYLSHEQLPPAAGAGNNEIPVDIDALDLEQKYRLDGWGRMFEYTTGALLTDLQDVNGFAASVVSGGPDQNIGTNDDIIKNIDLSVEAGQIVQKKLKVLMEKVAAYDALFAGVDNDGVDPANPNAAPDIDENPLAAAEMDSCYNPGFNPDPGCPPIASFCNDPASGLPTLDAIELAMDGTSSSYSCQPVDATGNFLHLAYHLAIYYHLPTGIPGGYDRDPWGNPFRWGCVGCGLTFDDPVSYNIISTVPDTMDPHYHKFFSTGPDLTIVEDDIIYTGE